MRNLRTARLPSAIFFCQVFRTRAPNALSTTTEREGKHEQETDNNACDRCNGRSCIRSPGTWRTSRRTPSSPRPPPSPSCSTPSPSPLRLGNRRGGSRNGCDCPRHRGAPAGRRGTGTGCRNSRSRSRSAAAGGGSPGNHGIPLVKLRYFKTSAGFLVRGSHTR